MRYKLPSTCSLFVPWTYGALLICLLGFVVAGCDNGIDANPGRLGRPCMDDASCAPRPCVDGVCCNNGCNDQCVACTAKKKGHGVDGECGVIVGGTDPDDECFEDQVCHGDESCSGSLPLGSTCSHETECWSGNCIDGVCCNENCWGKCRACTSAKKGNGEEGICGEIATGTDPDDDCTLVCDRPAACMLIVNGNPCRFDGECVDGHCVDEICCNATCEDLCMDCRADKKGGGINGECEPIAAGTDPNDECIGNVACSGMGTCVYFVNGAVCGMGAECESAICSDGICCNSPCIDSCVTCGLPGTEGTCMEISPNACPAVCEGPVAFKDAPSIPTGYIEAIFIADLNADGRADLVVGNIQTNTLDIYLRTGNKSFGPPTAYPNIHVTSIVVADFNGDGYPDLATSNSLMASHLSVLLNQGNGTFAQIDCATLGIPSSLVATDLNGDGKPDIAAVGNSVGVAVSLNNGNGTFATPINYPAGTALRVIVAADFNGDGKTDLATSSDPAGADVLMNKGDGTFGSAMTLPMPGSSTNGIAAADVNSDGKPDLVVAAHGGLNVVLNNGNGAFAASVYYTSRLWSIVATDLNGDGKIDIAGVRDDLAATGVVLNHGDGTFEPASYYDTADHPVAIAVGDLNDDGIADLAVGNDFFGGGPPVVHLLENEGPGTFVARRLYPVDASSAYVTATTADVTGDGKIDVIVAGADANALQVFQNNGFGVFTSSAPISLPGTRLLHAMTLDADGDGDRDIAVLKEGATHTLGVFLNKGTGIFEPMLESPLNVYATDMVAIELNGDGREDLALIADKSPKTEMRTYINQGTGKFVLKDVVSLEGYDVAIGAADLNADGHQDLVTVSYFGIPKKTHVFMNKGNGTFGPNVDYLVGSHPFGLAMADMTSDGLPEIVVTTAEGKVSVLVNHGNGTFEPYVDYDAPFEGLALVDMTGDGQRDIVGWNVIGHVLAILVKDGTGSFAPRVEYPLSVAEFVPGQQWGILVVPDDFDGDGKMDLAVLNQFDRDNSDSLLSVLYNRTVNACYPVP